MKADELIVPRLVLFYIALIRLLPRVPCAPLCALFAEREINIVSRRVFARSNAS